MLVKLCVALLVSACDENTDGHLYRTEWNLVRADSLGKWIDAGRDLLSGPQVSLLDAAVRPELDEIVTPTAQPVWHRVATESLHQALSALYPAVERLPKQTSFIHWLLLMGELRNKTKGHGAPLPAARATAVPSLERAIQLIASECPVLNWPVVFAEQEMSGQWRVAAVSDGRRVSVSAAAARSASTARRWCRLVPRWPPCRKPQCDTAVSLAQPNPRRTNDLSDRA